MEKQNNEEQILSLVSEPFKLRTKTKWFSVIVTKDKNVLYGLEDSKASSIVNAKASFCNKEMPEFITKMGSVNEPLKEFLVVEGVTSYFRDNVPDTIYNTFLPVVTINPNKVNEVSLVCEDVHSQELFYLTSKEKSFVESFENCIKQMHIEFCTPKEITETTPKINSWVLQYLKNQKVTSLDKVIHFTN